MTNEQLRRDIDEIAQRISDLETKIAELDEKLEITRMHTSYRTSWND